jgi:hypothetical protein
VNPCHEQDGFEASLRNPSAPFCSQIHQPVIARLRFTGPPQVGHLPDATTARVSARAASILTKLAAFAAFRSARSVFVIMSVAPFIVKTVSHVKFKVSTLFFRQGGIIFEHRKRPETLSFSTFPAFSVPNALLC